MKFGLLIGLVGLWAISPVAALAADAPAETESNIINRTYSSESKVKVTRDDVEPTAQPEPAAEVKKQSPAINEQSVWQAMQAGKYDEAYAVVEQLKQSDQAWQPSGELLNALANGHADALVRDGLRLKQWQQVIAASKRYPERFDCSHQYRRLGLAEAQLAVGSEQQAYNTYAVIMRQCKQYLRAEAMEHAAGSQLTRPTLAKLLELAKQRPWDRDGRARLAEIELTQLLLHQPGDRETLEQIGRIEGDLLHLKKTEVANLLGWAYLNGKQPAQALKLFRTGRDWRSVTVPARADALKGEILSLSALGRDGELRQLVRQHHETLAAAGMLTDLLPLVAAACGRAEDAACQVETLQELQQLRPLHGEEAEVLAWALHHSGEYGEAAEAFERRYREHPSEQAAIGLRESLIRANEPQRVAELGRELGGSLAAGVAESEAKRYYNRSLFRSAAAIDPQLAPELQDVESSYVRPYWMMRKLDSNTAVPLFSMFEIRKAGVEGGYLWGGSDSLAVRVERVTVDAGNGALRINDIGFKLPGPYPFAIDAQPRGMEWDIEYRREGWNSYYLGVGQGFSGGPASTAVKGRAGTLRHYKQGNYNLELYRQPLRERIFSYVGMTEPTTGQVWGRVMRNGIGLEGYHALGTSSWGISYSAAAEQLDGVNVERNSHQAVNIAIPYGFDLGHGISLTVGPQLRWQRYSKNQNHFTFGHGGYYSPQRDVEYGVSLHASSREGDPLQFVLDGYYGKGNHTEDAAPLFPLAPNGLSYVGKSINDTATYGRLKALYRVAPQWQLGGDVSYAYSSSVLLNAPNRSGDIGLMLYLTWQFGERRGSLSSDFPGRGVETLF